MKFDDSTFTDYDKLFSSYEHEMIVNTQVISKTPSYTDRILYYSPLLSSISTYCLKYDCVNSINISDHCPVYSSLAIREGIEKDIDSMIPVYKLYIFLFNLLLLLFYLLYIVGIII